jgi:hypothetical protein
MASSAARSIEDRVRRMAPVAAPPDQQAEVAELSRVLEGMLQPKRRAPKCKLVGPGGVSRAIPESVFVLMAWHRRAVAAASTDEVLGSAA